MEERDSKQSAMQRLRTPDWSEANRNTQQTAAELMEILGAESPVLDEMFPDGPAAYCTRDEIGLWMISAIINKSKQLIRVVGRGSQSVDQNSAAYIAAVAKAILRGVEYRRILVRDPELPQNTLLWMLMLERFLSSRSCRDWVKLRVLNQSNSNVGVQYQVVDSYWLHQVRRRYPNPSQPGSSIQAYSAFSRQPNPLVDAKVAEFDRDTEEVGRPLSHADVIQMIREMLNDYSASPDVTRARVEAALEAVTFLNSCLPVGSPTTTVRLLGTLAPFTYTHDAAHKWSTSQSTQDNFILVPFQSLDAMAARASALDYICVPYSNSFIGTLSPPLSDAQQFNRLTQSSDLVGSVEVRTSLVLAGRSPNPAGYDYLTYSRARST